MQRDLSHPGLIKLKGILFLGIGIISAALLLLEQPNLKCDVLLAICIWCFCRFYYFAFYVIEKYVDPSCKFSGLGSFFVYLLKRKSKGGDNGLQGN